LLCHTVFSQVDKVKKLVLQNEALQAVVASSSTIRSIRFYKDENRNLEIQPDNIPFNNKSLVYDNWYSTIYLGHRYLFQQQFGFFPAEILLYKLDSLRRQDCYTNRFEGEIFADHIAVTITSSCPGKSKSGDMIFSKVDDRPGFWGGPAAFQQMVQDRLACTGYRDLLQGDSAFFFFAVTKKDSMCHEVRTKDSIQSPLKTIIQNALTGTHGWKPYRKDGRNMNAYMQVFILLRKDGSIEADYIR
jgi:hypothetical protein